MSSANKACDAGYTAGWDSTCATALVDPNPEHAIYGCPGVSDKMINDVLDADSAHYRASLNSTAEKTECSNETSEIPGVREPAGGVPCI